MQGLNTASYNSASLTGYFENIEFSSKADFASYCSSAIVKEYCFAIKQGSLQIRREGDNINVNFRGSRCLSVL